MNLIAFVKKWTLPCAMVFGASVYLMFAYIEPLIPVGLLLAPPRHQSVAGCHLYHAVCYLLQDSGERTPPTSLAFLASADTHAAVSPLGGRYPLCG